MPTGYTAMLDDDPKMTTAKWLKEGISRAFGMCVDFRDIGNMTESQILNAMDEKAKGAGSYHQNELDKVRVELEKIDKDPIAYFTKEFAEYVTRTEKYNKKSTDKANLINSKHNKTKMELTTIVEQTTDQTTKNIAKYGLKQLNLVKSDSEPYIIELKTYQQFKLSKAHELSRDLEYHIKGLTEEIARESERKEAYLTFISEVNRILG